MTQPIVEHWGDEGELHVALGWHGAKALCESAYDYIKAEVGPRDVADYTEEVIPENVKHGWAMIVPEKHELLKNRDEDGYIIVSRTLFPPFYIQYDGNKGLRFLVGRPATWLRDH